MDVRAHVIVAGRVQGVSFRVATRDRARSRGVAGWVRNRPDGKVEAVFEGPEDAVRSLVDWTGRGPLGAEVDSVAVDWAPPEGERDFVIR
jgi:acylphosphatase